MKRDKLIKIIYNIIFIEVLRSWGWWLVELCMNGDGGELSIFGFKF